MAHKQLKVLRERVAKYNLQSGTELRLDYSKDYRGYALEDANSSKRLSYRLPYTQMLAFIQGMEMAADGYIVRKSRES